MSRRSRRRQRDANDVTTDQVLSSHSPHFTDIVTAPLHEPLVDRRHWVPAEPFVPDHTVGGIGGSVAYTPTPSVSPIKPASVQQQKRSQLSVCVRREQRRQVLHALRKTGKGGSRKPRRRNEWSNYKC